MLIKNAFSHLKKICKHKYWVGLYCFKLGMPWRGIKHDMSKFSPTEFFESIKYYKGTCSPIDACKRNKGYSRAWFHHRGLNDHHYEYWVDNFDNGGEALLMPLDCAMELLCDYIGAGIAYNKNNFTFTAEFKWWMKKRNDKLLMHPAIQEFVTNCLKILKDCEYYGLNPDYWFNRENVQDEYFKALNHYEKTKLHIEDLEDVE